MKNCRDKIKNSYPRLPTTEIVTSKRPLTNFGFSLVELMVSISIFMVITSVTLINYPKFSNKLSLDLLAEDVALSLRQAQIFGSSVLGARSGTGATKAFSAYGIHFGSPDTSLSEYNYILFADVNNSRQYDESERLQVFKITGFNRARSLCFDCDTLPQNLVDSLDVVFVRPSLDAKFKIKDKLGQEINSASVSNIGIVLESAGGGYTKTIVVWKTGQISVE